MIKLCNINKSYGKKILLNNVNMEFTQGEPYVIFGPSGSGKTTLLNIISQIDTPDSGDIIFKGEKLNFKNKTIFFKNNIAYLFQNYGLVDDATIYDNFYYLLGNEFKKKFSKKGNELDQYLKKFGLDVIGEQKVYELSGGEQQRLALARILLKKFDILVCDEPTGNLDDFNKKIVMDLLKEISLSGKIVIIVTHDSSFNDISNRIIKMPFQ